MGADVARGAAHGVEVYFVAICGVIPNQCFKAELELEELVAVRAGDVVVALIREQEALPEGLLLTRGGGGDEHFLAAEGVGARLDELVGLSLCFDDVLVFPGFIHDNECDRAGGELAGVIDADKGEVIAAELKPERTDILCAHAFKHPAVGLQKGAEALSGKLLGELFGGESPEGRAGLMGLHVGEGHEVHSGFCYLRAKAEDDGLHGVIPQELQGLAQVLLAGKREAAGGIG